MNATKTPSLFLSYSHDSPNHVGWVLEFAATLTAKGPFHVIVDVLSFKRDVPWNAFMARSIEIADYVLIISTLGYKSKAEALEGTSGVGAEAIITLTHFYQHPQKFIPIVRESLPNGLPAVPFYLQGFHYLDFRSDTAYDDSFVELVRTIRGAQRYVLDVTPEPLPIEPTRVAPRRVRATAPSIVLSTVLSNGDRLRQDFLAFFRHGRLSLGRGGRYPYIEPRFATSDPHLATENDEPVTARRLLDQFLDDHKSRVMVLLGDYGSGKTSFCYETCVALLADTNRDDIWLPIYLAFRVAPNILQDDMDQWMQNLLDGSYGATPQTRYTWPLSIDELRRFMESNRVLLVLDGLDESNLASPAAADSDYDSILQYIQSLPCKCILTSRTNYFSMPTAASVQSYDAPFARVSTHTVLVPREGVAVYFFLEFDEGEVYQYVSRSRLPEARKQELFTTLRASSRLRNLASKPVFAPLVAESDAVMQNPDLDVIDLYHEIIFDWVDTHRPLRTLTRLQVLEFLQELAFLMFVSNDTELTSTVLRQRLTVQLGDENLVRGAELDLTQCTFLVKTGAGAFTFSHNSFQEFLVASKIFQELCAYSNQSLYVRLLTDAINEFLVSLIERTPASPTAAIGDVTSMVPVPQSDEYDSALGVKVNAFYIDKYPVTCLEYAAFLKENPGMVPPTSEGKDLLVQLGDRTNIDWYVSDVDGYLEACKRFCWDAIDRQPPTGQADWPVIYVSYFDAWAYCRWKGRDIPRYFEWIKAGYWDPTQHGFTDYPLLETPSLGVNCNCDYAVGSPVPVNEYETVSTCGCYQMLGNVAEWIADWSDSRRLYRAIVGGSWHLPLEHGRLDSVAYALPNLRRNFIGFRTVLRT